MEKTAFLIFLIVLIVSPVLFGAVHPYAYTLMTLGVLAGTCLLLLKDTKESRLLIPRTDLNFLFLILLIYLFFQITPLPDAWVKRISPETWRVSQVTSYVLDFLDPNRQDDAWLPVSPYGYPVRASIIRFVTYGLFFFGFIRVLNSEKRIEAAVFAILAVCCFEALYGLFETYSGHHHALWMPKKSRSLSISGTYISRNNFGGLMATGILLSVAYSAALMGSGKRSKSGFGAGTGFRTRISEYLSDEKRFSKKTLTLFAGAITGMGLVLSASRGSLVSAAVGLLCFGGFLTARKRYRKSLPILILLLLIISFYAPRIGIEFTLNRFQKIEDNSRLRFAQKTMDMFKDFPFTGAGVGNFRYIYPRYQSALDMKKFIRYAHNDWAQFLSEAGIVGMCLLLTGMCYYGYRTLKHWKRRRDPFVVSLGAAPFTVMAALAFHSFFDFNLHIPANMLILTAVTAIGCRALHLKRHRGRGASIPYYTIPFKSKKILLLLPILALSAWTGTWAIRHFMAESYCNTLHDTIRVNTIDTPLENIRNAIRWDRYNAAYRYALAEELMKERDAVERTRMSQDLDGKTGSAYSKSKQIEIMEALETAIRLNPFNASYYLRLGWECTFQWQAPDYTTIWLPMADRAIQAATRFAGEKNVYLHLEIGKYWTTRSKMHDLSTPLKKIYWNLARRRFVKALELESKQQKDRLKKEIEGFVRHYYPEWMDIFQYSTKADG